MARLRRLCYEIWQIALEGSLIGALRFIWLKCGPRRVTFARRRSGVRDHGLGIIGAGHYLASTHLPCLRTMGAPLYAVTSRSGNSARAVARAYGIGVVHDSVEALLADRRCDSLLIATPHHLHVEQILLALESGLYTYCEKPVAIDSVGLELLASQALDHSGAPRVMVGFNRRFSPAIRRLRSEPWMRDRGMPMEIDYRVNFGPRVLNSMSDPAIGGGRIHGAACHYVDLIAFLADAPITHVSGMAASCDGRIDENTFVATMTLGDGSVASLSFSSEGDRRFDRKEELIVSCGGHVARVVNYARLTIDGRRYSFHRHRYGALGAWRAFFAAKRSGAAVPIGLGDGIAATRATLAIQSSLRNRGVPVGLSPASDFRASVEPGTPQNPGITDSLKLHSSGREL